jgi:hypothetical protein
MKQSTWELLEGAVLETLQERRKKSASPAAGISSSGSILAANGDTSKQTQAVHDHGLKDANVIDMYQTDLGSLGAGSNLARAA